MKTTTTQYLIDVKKLEKEAIEKLTSGKNVVYALKFKRKIKTKALLYTRLSPVLKKAYKYGVVFGKAIIDKIKEIKEGLTDKQISKYRIVNNAKVGSARYRLKRAAVFSYMIKEIDIERTRFISLYDFKVNAYLKDGMSRNLAKSNIDISKLEYEFINKVRLCIANTVYLFSQIGQIDGLKGGLRNEQR